MSEGKGTALHFRAAAPADLDAIVAIERESFSDPWSARSFRELMGRHNVLCEVAVRDEAREARSSPPSATVEQSSRDGALGGRAPESSRNGALGGRAPESAPRVVGFSVLYLAGTEGDLANLATSSSARREGVGRQLLAHVLELARSRGAHTIFLEVRESNSAARALYHSAGFVDVGRRAKYYARPVEDALVLRKELS